MNKEICAKTSSLSMVGETPDDLTPPAVGDEVVMEVKGRVSRVEGDMAYIEAQEINGEPVPEGMDKMGGMGESDREEDEIETMLREQEGMA